jgi:hypothetical protein
MIAWRLYMRNIVTICFNNFYRNSIPIKNQAITGKLSHLLPCHKHRFFLTSFFPFPIVVLKANNLTSSATSSPIYFKQLFIFKHPHPRKFLFFFVLIKSSLQIQFNILQYFDARGYISFYSYLLSFVPSNSSWSSFTQKSYITFILSFLSVKLFHLHAMSMLSHKTPLSHWLMIVKSFIRSYHGCWKHKQNLLRYSRDRLSRNQARNKGCWKAEKKQKQGGVCNRNSGEKQGLWAPANKTEKKEGVCYVTDGGVCNGSRGMRAQHHVRQKECVNEK